MVLRGTEGSSGVITIQNIKENLMGVSPNGWAIYYGIHFLWVDECEEDKFDYQYRIGFHFRHTEYSCYLHRNPTQNGLYYMGCYAPNMKEYRFSFTKEDFRLSSIFVSALYRKLKEVGIC